MEHQHVHCKVYGVKCEVPSATRQFADPAGFEPPTKLLVKGQAREGGGGGKGGY